ncbi:glycoside hydrolase family protein [Neokomagataea anthophila]|uniref:Glycosyl hydrolase family 32 N-terminal domain-containing protein n=1 Tax=Neokomagataea anthophila TaxID=2826925 RepID=A0ABS5E7Y8_9PROT|nr:hypothetical protein [Neokomagataea anthophila]MBR0560024.1 hypothetical protein [Neokomagataea anthophila]
MTAIWQPDTALSDILQTGYGIAFSRYRPLGHLTAEPYRNKIYNLPYSDSQPTPATVFSTQINADQYRPWINDPCRMIWDETCGLWRSWTLTSDNPEQPHQTWMELVSPDLNTWVVNRTPFYLDDQKYPALWGGSVVIDDNNTAGFGAGAVLYYIAMPGSNTGDTLQCITLWVAPQLGMAPVFYKVIISNPASYPVKMPGADFRDPRVFWDTVQARWVMSVCLSWGIGFYTSADGLNWTFQSAVNLTEWSQVETPDLLPMTDAKGQQKWALFFCLKTWNGQPYAGVGYLVGQWTGTNFIPDTPTPKLLNNGHDYYAQAITQKDGITYCWGWMGNWLYSQQLPTQGFAGNLSLVTQLTLGNDADGSARVKVALLEGQQNHYANYSESWNTVLSSTSASQTWSPPSRTQVFLGVRIWC